MDRSLESKAWQRGFAVGFLALALSIGGQTATSRWGGKSAVCPLAYQPGLAEQVFDHLVPTLAGRGVAQRVALAVLGAMLHRSACS